MQVNSGIAFAGAVKENITATSAEFNVILIGGAVNEYITATSAEFNFTRIGGAVNENITATSAEFNFTLLGFHDCQIHECGSAYHVARDGVTYTLQHIAASHLLS